MSVLGLQGKQWRSFGNSDWQLRGHLVEKWFGPDHKTVTGLNPDSNGNHLGVWVLTKNFCRNSSVNSEEIESKRGLTGPDHTVQ